MTMSAGRKKKSIPKSTNEMSKEMLTEILKKKKECNSKALSIVEKLCEPSLPDEDWFLTNLAFINQSHFEDIIVERAITKLCGYPLCRSVLENVPTKKYHISTRLNKVFDITERKNFCSNDCYKSGMYLKDQLLTSPLWFRDQEKIPVFKLLRVSSSTNLGDEVVFFPEREQLKKDIATGDEEESNDSQVLSEKLENVHLGTEEDKECVKKEEILVEESANASVSREETVKTEELPDTRKTGRAPDPVEKVEKCVHEWFTLDAVLYLYGEDKVKEIMRDREEQVKEILGKKPLIPGYSEKMDAMIKFYSVLNEEIFGSESVNRNLNPLPDYSAVKEDGRKLEVKVKAFYSGQLEVGECDASEGKREEEEEREIYLPAVDAHAQNTLRTKILLDRLNRVVPELVRTLTGVNCFEISELRDLVSRFALSADNITFKPGEWYLVACILVKLLSVKNKRLECLLKSEKGRNHVTLFLMNYGLPGDYLENVVEWLVDAEDLIKKLS